MASSTVNSPDIVDDFDALGGTEIIARNSNNILSDQPPYGDTDATELPLGNVAKDYDERRSSSSSNIKEGGFFKKNKRMVKIGAGVLAGTLVLCAAIFGSAAVTGNSNSNSNSMVRSQFNAAPKATKAPKGPSVSNFVSFQFRGIGIVIIDFKLTYCITRVI